MKKKVLLAAVLVGLLLLQAVFAGLAEGQPSLSLDPAEITLDKGKSQKLKPVAENVENARKIKYAWESSDPAVASVNNGGAVKAADAGTAVITCTATLPDGNVLTATASVTVRIPVKGLKSTTKANTAFPARESLQLEYTLQPENATDRAVAWTSSDEGIATVDENGVVTGVAPGKVTITGTAANGKGAKVNLQVTPAVIQGKQLEIREAVFHPETGQLEVTWVNTGSGIAGAELRINPLDGEGNPVRIGEGYIEEIPLEERVLHTSMPVPAGETVTVSLQTGSAYPAAAQMEIAVDRITREDGSVLELPDNRLCWYSTAAGAYTAGPESDEPYQAPEEDIQTAADVRFGFRALAVPGELAAAYGFPRGGLLVTEIGEGSAAEAMGLETWDLVFGVNETGYDGELYILPQAAAALSRGEAVTLWIARDGEVLTIDLEPGE